ncbi:hypothetical protein CPC08DRAFT_729772 [Agrocybe pediades]|nr:hypothetical protein CPC08DRAFT_729772 [Agrocybe pediades]
MKSNVFLSLFSVAGMLSASVFALDVDAAVKEIDAKGKTDPKLFNPACFWSGTTADPSGKKVAAKEAFDKFKKDHHCKEPEDLLVKLAAYNPKEKLTDIPREQWVKISEAFIAHVNPAQDVNVLLGKDVAKESIWKKTNIPALAKRGVSKVHVYTFEGVDKPFKHEPDLDVKEAAKNMK